uniref:Uncharacterized protein n=1 Tax=Romanomermis culicivorax TaxID=13658 RepID=A0A915KXT9_ROMCU
MRGCATGNGQSFESSYIRSQFTVVKFIKTGLKIKRQLLAFGRFATHGRLIPFIDTGLKTQNFIGAARRISISAPGGHPSY